jgi:hypothetical protein
VGGAGVSLVLAAFVLNLAGVLPREHAAFPALSLVGSTLGCAAAVIIGFAPFVVLNAVWAMAAAVAIASRVTRSDRRAA